MTEKKETFIKEIGPYEMWLSDHGGRYIRRILSLMKREEMDPKGLFHSGFFPGWKRELKTYEKAFEDMKRLGIGAVGLWEEAYPALLREIYDPPFLLYYRGKLIEKEEICFGIVGTRRATDYGKWAARRLGELLGGNGINVVSGMAFGIDAQAHRGALEAGGRTTAVLGSGPGLLTPAANRSLGERILESGGCVLSECLPLAPGLAYHYPRRNRIISGLCRGVAVVEAGDRSGAAITADMALEQGRDVYALPGNITSPVSLGTNRLIKEGATPLVSLDSVLWEGAPEAAKGAFEKKKEREIKGLSREEGMVYAALEGQGADTAQKLSLLTGFPLSRIQQILTVLELKGMVLKNRNKIIIAK